MPYQALARQWRPRRFQEVVGQPHVVQALSHALTTQKLHHAYLFTGTHGTGKTTTARIFAKCLNCETGITATPCDQCTACQSIDEGRFPDLFEIDAASRTKVEDTRELLDNIPYAPTFGRFKIYLIDEVHMLSGHSFNALLKTLEEPPAHVKFLLATTDPQKLPATVLSRCLQFHLSLIAPSQIAEQLAHILSSEKIEFEKSALDAIAEAAEGSLRDSLSLLDQCIAYSNGKITHDSTQKMLGLSNHADIDALLNAIHNNDGKTALTLTAKWAGQGVNFSRALTELIKQLFQLATKQFLKPDENAALSPENIQLYYQIALMGQRDLSLAPTAQMGFEMIVMRMMAFTPRHASNTPPINPTQKTAEPAKAVEKPITAPTSSNWGELFNQLGLTGPTLALAQHCSLRNFSENELQLTLLPKYSALLNERQRERIQEAVVKVLGTTIRVTIIVDANASLETPAVSAGRLKETRQQSAKKAISADPTVQRIVNTFGATVIENSIEPLK
ncbi:MAG: DNA polymerase III subunit gamma/tau [Coxiellaceae bacterium]|nr:DNA polymerase III subunit gamma/tau [Coxiellaceae bacterium]